MTKKEENYVVVDAKFSRIWARVMERATWLERGRLGKYEEFVRDLVHEEFDNEQV